MYKILAENFNSINYILKTDSWQPNKELKEQIENIWQIKLKEAKEKNKILTSNQKVRVKDFEIKNNKLILTLEPTTFKEFIGTRENKDMENTANILSIGAISITSDNYIILGTRSNNLEGEDQIHLCPAGYVDLGDLQGIGASIERSLLGELLEEVGTSEYKEAKPFALIDKEEIRQPMLVYILRLNKTKNEIIDSWNKLVKKEFKDLFFVENSKLNLNKLLENESEIRPHALGALKVYLEKLSDNKEIKKVYILGMDGNVIDNYNIKAECAGLALKETIEKYKNNEKTKEFYSKVYIETSGKNSLDQWKKAWELTMDNGFLEETEIKFRYLLEQKEKEVKMFPDAENFLKSLKENEKAVITTTVPIDKIEKIAHSTGLINYISLFLTRGGVYIVNNNEWEIIRIPGFDKGEKHYEYVLNYFNIRKEKLIAISSTKQDTKNAKDFGLTSIGIKHLFKDENILKNEGADLVLESFNEIKKD